MPVKDPVDTVDNLLEKIDVPQADSVATRRVTSLAHHFCGSNDASSNDASSNDVSSTSGNHSVQLNYRRPPANGKYAGRYIGTPDLGDAIDVCDSITVTMHNARNLASPAELETTGFTLQKCPTKVQNFRDDDELIATYYDEMIELVKQNTGADRVFVFDHTVRNTESANLNALEKGSTAGALPRVHCDYTSDSAPARLKQLAKEGIYSKLRKRMLTEEDMGEVAKNRFSFINVWRSIDKENPIRKMPLAVCDPKSVSPSDPFLYTMFYPDRVGENYGLSHSDAHKWHYYPEMQHDECLLFKVYDQEYDGPRFVFHTAFDDPNSPADAPPRQSIEIRAIAFFDVDGSLEDEPLAYSPRAGAKQPHM
jgi:hypothetical protein